MNYYYIALRLADAAFIGMWLAAGYYFARTVLTFVFKTLSLAGLKDGLQHIVQSARGIHPYIGLAVLLAFPYHAYTMFTMYGISAKTVLGGGGSVTTLITIALGLTLWRDRSNLRLRLLHRRSMFLLLTVVTWHAAFKL